MNQELAQKLKEAGFPQNGNFDFEWDMASPTLSELIDAMPMRAKYLGTVNDAHFVLRKMVVGAPGRLYRALMEDEDTGKAVEGYNFIAAIPEEAVGKLWLALNKK